MATHRVFHTLKQISEKKCWTIYQFKYLDLRYENSFAKEKRKAHTMQSNFEYHECLEEDAHAYDVGQIYELYRWQPLSCTWFTYIWKAYSLLLFIFFHFIFQWNTILLASQHFHYCFPHSGRTNLLVGGFFVLYQFRKKKEI